MKGKIDNRDKLEKKRKTLAENNKEWNLREKVNGSKNELNGSWIMQL